MSEIKTVTHEGKVYQIGQDYLFSDDRQSFFYGKLHKINSSSHRPFLLFGDTHRNINYCFIKEVPASERMGTITPAPIELVDGAAYMFNSIEDNLLDAIGVYSKVHNTLTTFKNLCAAFDCTNIRLMTVESK